MILYYIFTSISLLFFLISLVIVIRNIASHSLGTSTALVICLLFLSVLFARYPVIRTIDNLHANVSDFFIAIFKAIVHTLQTFSLDEDYSDILSMSAPCVNLSEQNVIRIFYENYISILNVCAPVVTYTVILAYIASFVDKAKLLFSINRKKVIFSVLNEKTLIMGEKLRSSDKKSIIIYTNASTDFAKHELYKARIKKIYAICKPQNIASLTFRHNKKRMISYILAENEIDNFENCSQLLQNKFLTNKLVVNIYVLSVSKSSVNLFSELLEERKNKNIMLYPFDEDNVLIYKMLLEYPLYLRSQRGRLSAMIIGDSHYAYEAFKAFLWCGSYSYYDFTLHVVTNNIKSVKEKLESECPEIFSCNEYNIHFAELNPFNKSFDDYLNTEAKDVNYIFISTDSISENLQITIKVAKLYDTIHLRGTTAPICTYIIDKDDLYDALKPLHSSKNKTLLIPYGNFSNRYDINSFLDSELERMSLAVHLTYYQMDYQLSKETIDKIKYFMNKGADFTLSKTGISDKYNIDLFDELIGHSIIKKIIIHVKRILNSHKLLKNEEFIKIQTILFEREKAIAQYYESIYGRNSSYASSIHALYRLYLAGILNDTNEYTDIDVKKYSEYVKNFDNLIYLARMEHHRWNAYMRTEGFRKPTEEEYQFIVQNTHKHKSAELKLHPCLVEWNKNCGMPLCDQNLNRNDKYYNLYHVKDREFLKGDFLNVLDELDRISLITSEINPSAPFEHKISDAVIVQKAPDILRAAKGKGKIL